MNTISEIHKQLQKEIDDITINLHHLKTSFAFTSLNSTNDHALILEKSGIKSGTIVIASRQFLGRGRLKRTWFMQEGDIALSIILRPPFLPKNWALLPMIPAIAIVRALKELSINVRLKWPNDIIIPSISKESFEYFANFRKLGGILVENVFFQNDLSASIIGIGLNIVDNSHLRTEVLHAGSLQEVAPALDRFTCLKSILICFDEIICELNNKEYELLLFDEYVKNCESLGRDVRVLLNQGELLGRAKRINPDGSMVIDDGMKEHTVFAGDVGFI